MGVPYPNDRAEKENSVASFSLSSSGCATFERLREAIPRTRRNVPTPNEIERHLPETTPTRQRASVAERSLERDEHLPEHITNAIPQYDGSKQSSSEKTVLYLAYGSNMASKTFLGMRGIRPLSQINVIVPELRLTFDIPGLPYVEPCFAASQFRDPSKKQIHTNETERADENLTSEKAKLIPEQESTSLPDRPLVGVVYEVSLTDYAQIIATEGGGNGYQDIVIDCYPFPKSYNPVEPIPECPETKAFKAHTLLSPVAATDKISQRALELRQLSFIPRSGPSVRQAGYAQPSARYLNLLITGAIEHNLPIHYREYLSRVQTYRIANTRQRIGKGIFLITWGPPMLLILRLSRIFAGPDGRSPHWLKNLSDLMLTAMWGCYDHIFLPLFGDGERTINTGI
ncbi:hypothetical protein BDV25DRAFT_67327 [Aspergillus avenaceus]|uniref:gamma-glutamylcyclotransferase n=1 Tax=Aspergillus avenaceus TaxID=36643 RepID=A0A5N6U1J8_ASPAV|nr:hypothetical protein BDV25DRAFT_67327 [Aspergillus avenaceus]